jgi:hypothetical protein
VRSNDDPRPQGARLRKRPKPPPVEWAVKHPEVNVIAHRSPRSVLYTLSQLPGGTLLRRVNGGEWQDTTEAEVRAEYAEQQGGAS